MMDFKAWYIVEVPALALGHHKIGTLPPGMTTMLSGIEFRTPPRLLNQGGLVPFFGMYLSVLTPFAIGDDGVHGVLMLGATGAADIVAFAVVSGALILADIFCSPYILDTCGGGSTGGTSFKVAALSVFDVLTSCLTSTFTLPARMDFSEDKIYNSKGIKFMAITKNIRRLGSFLSVLIFVDSAESGAVLLPESTDISYNFWYVLLSFLLSRCTSSRFATVRPSLLLSFQINWSSNPALTLMLVCYCSREHLSVYRSS